MESEVRRWMLAEEREVRSDCCVGVDDFDNDPDLRVVFVHGSRVYELRD